MKNEDMSEAEAALVDNSINRLKVVILAVQST